MSDTMKKIEGSPKNLKQLLQNTKYSIHYYQREYMWQRKHIEELIDDLTTEFLESYKEGDERQDVQDYGAYFMGSIVLAGRENAIIDGQQRFSTLTLLLIYLNNRIKNMGESYRLIEEMIYSESYGKESFNIDVDDRQDCMRAIFHNEPYDIIDANESVKNLYGRFNDIKEIFPEDSITDDMLLHFCDWLANKVFFIEIVATTEQDAHKVFVTMNDRGLSLTSTEMLKGYLLSEIKDDKKREELNNIWKDKILQLRKDNDDGDETFIKAWLRSQYAESIRESKAGAVNKDFDIIGGSFHKWVRDERSKIGLNTSEDFELFIKKFNKYSDVYLKIKRAEKTFFKNTQYVYYNAKVDFTLQSQVLLAPICYDDDWNTVREKMNLTARFIDLYILSRFTYHKRLGYNYIKNYIFRLTKDIRQCSIDELKEKLNEYYIGLSFDSAHALPGLHLTSSTRRYIKHMLARITSFIEEETGVASNYVHYMGTNTKNPFEIEHIISDHYEWFTKEYDNQEEFKYYRNNIGALLLLHKSINASLNDSKYPKKLKKYCSNEGNIYSESLGEQAYKNNPKFIRFMNKHELSFKPYDTFGKDEIMERNDLLVQLVNLVWNPDMFRE